MLSIRLRPLVLALVAMLVLVGCGGDDSDDGGSSSASGSSPSAAEDASVDSADDGFDQEAFCDAAGDFAIASDGGPDASTPEEVEERVTAMSDAADAVAETVPEDITEEAQAFADAIDGLEQYAGAGLRGPPRGRQPRVPVRGRRRGRRGDHRHDRPGRPGRAGRV